MAAPDHDPLDGPPAASAATDTPSPPASSPSLASPAAPPAGDKDAPAAPKAAHEPRVRLFVAVNLPVKVTQRIADEAQAVRRALAPEAARRVAWVPAANLHVTLAFLGHVRETAIEAIRGALTRATEPRAPFDLEARGLGAFPSLAQPRVLWAGLVPDPALAALQQDVASRLEGIGFPREARPFHPHVTIGRVTDGDAVTAGAIAAFADALREPFAARATLSLGGGRVTEVVLYESRTHRAGAEYVARARVALGPRGATRTPQPATAK